MRDLPRIGSGVITLCLLGILRLATAQSSPQLIASSAGNLATIRSVQVVPLRGETAIEIIGSRPLVPEISKIDDPTRLVIDIPGAVLSGKNRRVEVQDGPVGGLRMSVYQSHPPVTRVVVDLNEPAGYTWDAAGNRLTVRLHSAAPQTTKPPSVPAFTQGVQPVAVPVSSGSSGAVLLAGSRIAPGSSVSAGSDTAVLRLARGGEVRVCPGTTVSVTSSQTSSALMLGMSTGALEAHYYLDASADSVLTPDFRVLLPGPGEFHYAISSNSRGDTCVRALPGNTASVIVSELLGDGTYQVKPTEQIVFHSGKLNLADSAVPVGCGCPASSVPVMRAGETPASVVSEAKLQTPLALGSKEDAQPAQAATSQPGLAEQNLAAQVKLTAANSQTAPLPALKPNDIHIQIDAPFVFRAEDVPPARSVPAAPVREAALLPVGDRPIPATIQPAILPPPSPRESESPAHHGFFARVKNFFAAIFG